MFDWPVVGWMARNGGVVPVDRGAADVEAFRLAQRVLAAGHVLMVFPEGTRSPTGELQRPKDGLAMLALRTNATIVPIGVSNTDRVWPKGRGLPRIGGHATMRVGEPFRLADELPRGPRPEGREGRRDRPDHAPDRRAPRRAPARPLRRGQAGHEAAALARWPSVPGFPWDGLLRPRLPHELLSAATD